MPVGRASPNCRLIKIPSAHPPVATTSSPQIAQSYLSSGFSPDLELKSCSLEFAPIRRSRIGTKMGTQNHRFLKI
jgi:hypothetical protein